MKMTADGVVRCIAYEAGRCTDVPLAEAPARSRNTDGFVWVDLVAPTAADVAGVAERFELPELAVAEVVAAHQRPKLETHGPIALVVLKPVDYIDSDEVVEVTEIAIFLGPGFVVTVRPGTTTALDTVRTELAEDGAHPELGPTQVLYRATDLVVDGYELAIDGISNDVDEIEVQVFGGDESDRSQRIYKLKREVAEFRRAVVPLARTLERLAGGRVQALAAESAPYFRGLHDHLLRAADGVEQLDRLLSDILAANVAQVSVRQAQISLRQNEDMRKISAWAAIALVPTALAGIYGMNFEHMPELEWRLGYPMVLAVIGATCVTLYRLFRRNQWL